MSKKGYLNNGYTTSEMDYYYQKGYQQGRTDAIDEVKKHLERYFDYSDIADGWNCADIMCVIHDECMMLKEQNK